MRPDLDKSLCADFPNLYRERHGDVRETRMADGFPGDGWEPLIRAMSETIEPFCVGTDLRCAQIKQKHGILRVYMESSASIPDEVRAAVSNAVGESARTCEGCGAPRRPRSSSLPLCDSCGAFAKEWYRRRSECTPADREWLEQFRGESGRLLAFDDALSRWRSRAPVPNTAKLDIFGRAHEPLADDDPYRTLLARRVPREDIVVGRAYVIHARNGGVGVAVEDDGHIGYRLHREKWGEHYLFTEIDWADDPNFGTAIPLRLIEAEPPTGKKELLKWLTDQTNEHRAEIDAAWEVILPGVTSWRPRREPPP